MNKEGEHKKIESDCKQKKMEFGRLSSTYKDHEEQLARLVFDNDNIQKVFKEKTKEHQILIKKCIMMQADFDYCKDRRDHLR